MYTWYVNGLGDVQIYEGHVHMYQIDEHYSTNDAMNYRGVNRCKYWIPRDKAHVFFSLIGNPTYTFGYTGETNIDVSEFLD